MGVCVEEGRVGIYSSRLGNTFGGFQPHSSVHAATEVCVCVCESYGNMKERECVLKLPVSRCFGM